MRSCGLIAGGSWDDVARVIRTAIKDNFLFRHLSAEIMERVVTCFEPHPVRTGDAVITQGDKGDGFYIVSHGRVHVHTSGGARAYACS